MKNFSTSTLVLALVLSFSSSAFGDSYENRIVAGFDNMLNHEPYWGPTEVSVPLPTPDPVAEMIYAALRQGSDEDHYGELVMASFDNMLRHDTGRARVPQSEVSATVIEPDRLPEIFRTALEAGTALRADSTTTLARRE